MIQTLSIKNFRGIRELSVERMTPITVLTGKNNVGKSSVLEALFFLYDHSSADVFTKLNGFRGDLMNAQINLWEPLFYQMNPDVDIQINAGLDSGKERRIRYYKDTQYLPTQAPGPEHMGELLSSVKASYSLGFEYQHDDYHENGHFSAGKMGILMNIETSLEYNEQENRPWMLYVSPAAPRMTMDVIEWIGNLEISGRKDQAVQVLQMIDSNIHDIFNASQNGQFQLYIKRNGTALPLKYAGDGMVRLLYLMAAILSNPDSILLIDEIENGFHYSMYEKLWQTLAALAKEHHCQIIATTHSYENIRGSINGLKAAGCEDSYSLHRLERMDGAVIDKSYDWDMAELSVSREIEVR